MLTRYWMSDNITCWLYNHAQSETDGTTCPAGRKTFHKKQRGECIFFKQSWIVNPTSIWKSIDNNSSTDQTTLQYNIIQMSCEVVPFAHIISTCMLLGNKTPTREVHHAPWKTWFSPSSFILYYDPDSKSGFEFRIPLFKDRPNMITSLERPGLCTQRSCSMRSL